MLPPAGRGVQKRPLRIIQLNECALRRITWSGPARGDCTKCTPACCNATVNLHPGLACFDRIKRIIAYWVRRDDGDDVWCVILSRTGYRYGPLAKKSCCCARRGVLHDEGVLTTVNIFALRWFNFLIVPSSNNSVGS